MTTSFTHAVITGGAGFLGSHLCERLLASGTRVICLDDFSSGRRENVAHLLGEPGFRLVEHDVTEPWDPGRGAGRVDLVAHLASAASPVDYFSRPIATLRAGSQGTENALGLAGRHGARFLLASTSEVYGDPQEHPQPESYRGHVDPIGPRSVYDEAKRYAEAMTSAHRREYGLDTTIARIFNTYGPRMRPDDGRMVPAFLGQALAGKPLTVAGTGEQTRSLCYVDDTVGGLLALAGSGHPGPVNIGNPQERSVREFAEAINDLVGLGSPIGHVPAAVDDPCRRCPDITLAREQIGWEPEVELSDGLARTSAWFAARMPVADPA
ncbi:UDP-glucuronic acid decarboxylase family protein [Pseudonocardia sp. KRD291]|uniref:UDP-glucuronic acid decarboxylase family protein n=1 Tax=Pseudonocardia sp. KRD291 TaxID=2792007 RepID=UPI001C4A23A5|nr:UDP-glucuronic acid decarboxylase family protein [Pseudonocardia sp. KRD291]MBW0101314.1 SDR family oxidoreductase [Pseudonocardia sp. KRD291]